jgi:two-component sensor histidine kinase
VPGGKIEVTWQIEPEDSAQYFAVFWCEHGGAPVAKPSKAGLGTNLMKFSIERGLTTSCGARSGEYRATCRPNRLMTTAAMFGAIFTDHDQQSDTAAPSR